MKQRIALVAASALTAGFLSVVAMPAANATVPTTGTLHLATTASTTGAAAGAGLVVGSTPNLSALTSAGLVVASASSVSAAGTATGYILPTASLAFAWADATAATQTSLVVSGGVITTCNNTATGGTIAAAIPISNDSTSCYNATVFATPVGAAYAAVKPTGAAGSTMTVAAYVGASVSAISPTTGTLLGIYTFSVVASGVSGIVSTSQSSAYIQAPIAKTAIQAGTSAYDSSGTVQNGQAGVAYITIKDAYKAAVTSGTLTATATNSATVKLLDTATTGGAYTASSSFDSITNTDGLVYLVVNQPVADKAGTSTVTISIDGTVIGTKTWNWVGDIASITITSDTASSFINGYALATPIVTNPGAIGNVVYVAKDAAGNAVTLTAQPTVDSATGAMVGATVYSGNVAVDGGAYQTSSVGYGYTTMAWGAGTSLRGAGTYRLKLTNAVGTSIYSAVQTVTVSNGGPNSFTASWDKASYAPGDIATLTIAVKDIYGNLVGAGTALPGLTAGLIVASGLTAVGTACTNTSYTDSLGVKTCKFAAGNTEGSYSYSIDLDTVTPQSPLLGAVKVASTTATVSNAQVLQSIVALIASINKQIQALQALILKKK